MKEAELVRLIRQVIRQELTPILMAKVVSTEDQNRSSVRRIESEGAIPRLRNIQPFGVSSRAPAGTDCLTIPVAGQATHLIMAGAFDEARPAGDEGETFLYDAYGHMVYLSKDKMQFGSKASSENMVLGQVFKDFAKQLLSALAVETHIGNLGYATDVPINKADYEALKASPIEDEAVLSDIAFTEKG
jgi:hypothetical protein